MQYFGGMKRGNVRASHITTLHSMATEGKSGSPGHLECPHQPLAQMHNGYPEFAEWMIECTSTQRMIGMYNTALCLMMNKPVSPARLWAVWGKRPFITCCNNGGQHIEGSQCRLKDTDSRGGPHRFTSCLLCYETLNKLFNLIGKIGRRAIPMA